MTATLVERVDNLEKELAQIKRQIAGNATRDDWHAWFGASKDDPGFDEMIRLGREYRNRQREDYDTDQDAGS
jgi:hypothetical protein